MRRVIVSVVALLALTAFAPAPLPRSERRGGAVTLPRLQGDWKVVSFDTVGADRKLTPIGKWFQGVRIKGDRWIYLVNGQENLSFRITIGDGRPATIDYFNLSGQTEKPYMIGIAGRQAGRVAILYYWMPATRATSFEEAPANWWLLILERG
jgi:uncharacterized protein (TIGR03067 family)